MKLKEIVDIVGGRVLSNHADLNLEIVFCGASDLMSDVLAYVKPNSLLLTGLVNPQVLRTSEMAEIAAIIFVRGKTPGEDAIALAEELNIPLIASPYGMYEMCGRLYEAGLPPVMEVDKTLRIAD
jgi:predicted transcriptional regulator